MKKFLLIIIFLSLNITSSFAELPHFLDFKLILNESIAGKKAQNFLKNKLEKGAANLKEKEKNILEEEKKIIQQKKVISNDEYKKKLTELRNKVSTLRTTRNKLLESVAKERAEAKKTLLKNLNPILKEYMKENKIRMVVDKKNVLLADENLDITKNILEILNKKLKNIPLK